MTSETGSESTEPASINQASQPTGAAGTNRRDQPALIVIDMQTGFDDPYWGPTTNNPACEDNVAALLSAWVEAELPIVTVRHDSVNPSSPLAPGKPTNGLYDFVAAITPDLFITKTVNSAFHGSPDLHAWLQNSGIDRIVLCGIQTNMCVETTARVGGNLGYNVAVALDATRTFDLVAPDGSPVPADTLMKITATNLAGGGFATIRSTAEILTELS